MKFLSLFSYWMLPVISGLTWLGTLLGLLLHWIINDHGRPYAHMSDQTVTVVFISNIGAGKLKPLFIAGCVVTTVFLDLAFLSERWLRHRGRLVPNQSMGEKVLAILTLVFALVGTVGLILLSIFDTANYGRVHNIMLFLFIAGYMLSAVFICWEHQRLGIKNREHRLLRDSFWIKLTFILLELALVITFAALSWVKQRNAAAVLEWVISVVFSFYVFSFVFDLWPAIRTKDSSARFPKPALRDSDSDNHIQRNMEMA